VTPEDLDFIGTSLMSTIVVYTYAWACRDCQSRIETGIPVPDGRNRWLCQKCGGDMKQGVFQVTQTLGPWRQWLPITVVRAEKHEFVRWDEDGAA
jgi:hypothetical protein